ncbi:centromere protein W-like [Centroberyx gerrardi]|uniref:centromere protein W-like n=1 Tax=Centroberyx gerrardi TaxID=166262 RepID=UPI003AAE2B16
MMKRAPRSTLKSIIKTKTKSRCNVTQTTDAMVELLMLLFLNGLAEEARTQAFQDKSSTVRAQHVRAVSKKMLKKSRG